MYKGHPAQLNVVRAQFIEYLDMRITVEEPKKIRRNIKIRNCKRKSRPNVKFVAFI